MQKTPIILENAKTEIRNDLENIMSKNGLSYSVMDEMVTHVLSEIREKAKIEYINAVAELVSEQKEELEKAKAAAKKVLPAGDQQGEGNPEE